MGRDSLRHTVVILPGIGGSVLERSRVPVWGRGVLPIASQVLRPSALACFDGDGIRATRLVASPTFLPGFAALKSYDGLLQRIEDRFGKLVVDHCHPDADPVPGATVLCVPYDFRRSIVDCADHVARTVSARLTAAGLSERERLGRVLVIAHSFGGLVARWWLGPGGGGPLCRALLTLGTPHRGAPKALDWLVNGVRLKGVQLGGATDVIRTWPSAYELLPRYEAVLDEATGRHLRPHEIVAEGFDARAAAAAFAVHQEIETSWGPDRRDGPRVTPLIGRFHPTLDRATMANGRLRVEKRTAEWLRVDDWAGDGTVPAFAALPLDLDNDEGRGRRRIPTARHSGLPEAAQAIQWLESIEGRHSGAVRGDGQSGPTLGLDVEEWYPAGETIEVGACLRGSTGDLEGGETGAKVWVAGGGGAPVELHPTAGGRWEGKLAGMAPGTRELTLSATGRPGGEPRPVRELIAVVDE